MKIIKKTTLVMVLLIILLSLSACDNNSDDLSQGLSKNNLKVDISTNYESRLTAENLIKILSLEERISEITKAIVSVNGETQIGALGDSYVFSHLQSGVNYTVTVSLYGLIDGEGEEKELYSGEKEITVIKGELTEAVIDVYPLNAERLVVNIYDENSLPISPDIISEVKLYHPTLADLDTKYSATMSYNGNTIIFTNNDALPLISSYWHLKVVLTEDKLESNEIEFLFLPAEEKEINLVLTNGGSELSIQKIGGPESVGNLILNSSSLSWTWSGINPEDMGFFTVLYSENLPLADGEYFISVSDKIPYQAGTTNYNYNLSNLKSGYYLVRAYNKDGYGSSYTSVLN